MKSIYYKKYLKYKNRYIKLKQFGGDIETGKFRNLKFKQRPISEVAEDESKVLFYFGHYGDDNFVNCSRLSNNFTGHFVYFIDDTNRWYQDMFDNIKQFIDDNYSAIDKYIFMGASMGGYASMYMSTIYPTKSVSIAVGPQTMNLNNKITLHENLEWYDEDQIDGPSIQKIHQSIQICLIDSLDTIIINSNLM